MKTVKIGFVDFWRDFDVNDNPFTNILKKHYNVVIDNENPDFAFCSHFGTDYLKYKCVRILYLGEAKAPDFNIYDYAIAFDDIKFGDRYLQYPYLFFRESFKQALDKHTFSDDYYLSKKKFCNVVVSNNLCDKKRDEYFKALEPLTSLSTEIRRCILSEDEIADDASTKNAAIFFIVHFLLILCTS